MNSSFRKIPNNVDKSGIGKKIFSFFLAVALISSAFNSYLPPEAFGYTGPTVSASPLGGTYESAQSVTLTASAPSTIYYTTDGSTPTTSSTSGTSPLSGIVISTNSTLKFFAQDSLGSSSPVSSAAYTILVPPTASVTPSNGTYNSTKSVTLTASVPSTIYYTTDGTTPTTSSTSSPSPVFGITISTNSTLKFFAKNSVGNVSPVSSAAYTILVPPTGTPPTPTPQCNTTAVSQSSIPSYHLAFLLQSTASPSSYSANLGLFEKHLKPGDFLFISGNPNSTASTVLAQTQAARALVSPGVNVCSLELYFHVADLKGSATKLPKGFDYIGYDYEQGAQYSPEFTTNETASIGYFDMAQAAVKKYDSITQSNARFMVTPPYGELRGANWDWGLAAKHMDAISMQTQSFLNDSVSYGNMATSLAYEIRQGSPNTQLFMQISIDPSKGTLQDNVNAINTLKTLPLDGTLVYYNNLQTSDLQRLFTMLNR